MRKENAGPRQVSRGLLKAAPLLLGSVLEQMTEVTGGKAYFPNSVYELEDICTKIAVELKNQYLLGYASSNPSRDGRWRKIKVKLNAPRGLPALSVRSKTGYFGPTG